MYTGQVLGEEKFWSASSIDCPALQVREEYKLNEYWFSFISPSPIYVSPLSLSLCTIRSFCVK